MQKALEVEVRLRLELIQLVDQMAEQELQVQLQDHQFIMQQAVEEQAILGQRLGLLGELGTAEMAEEQTQMMAQMVEQIKARAVEEHHLHLAHTFQEMADQELLF
jgi:hypothetical protein